MKYSTAKTIQSDNRVITPLDMDLYSHCPKLYFYYKYNNLPLETFKSPMEVAVEKSCTWLFTYVIQHNMLPDHKTFDLHVGRVIPPGTSQKELMNFWLTMRKFLAQEAPNIVPLWTNVNWKTGSKNTQLLTICPVIGHISNRTKPILILFKTFSPDHYHTDWHIKTCLYLGRNHIPELEEALIYHIDVDNQNVTRHYQPVYYYKNFRTAFKIQMHQTIQAVANGPYHPIYRCTRKNCIHWNDCAL